MKRVVELAYLGLARAAGRYLVRGECGAAVYLRGGPGSDNFIPGLSDIDLAIVTAPDGGVGAARVRRRWELLRLHQLPAVGLVVDWPLVYDQAELRGVFGASAFTVERSAYTGGGGAKLDAIRVVERPELYAAGHGLRLVAGLDRLPLAPPRSRQEHRIAAWLELLTWWRHAFPYLADPEQPRAADLSVKLVAESARVWLWLAHGERAAGRADALRRALRRLPDEEHDLSQALAVRDALPRLPAPAWDVFLPLSVRLSVRVAELLDTEVAEAGFTEVRLSGDAADLIPGGGLPLADWRALACLEPPDDAFVVAGAAADDPSAYADAAADGLYPALLAGALMVLPARGLVRTRLRAVKCAAVDPVPFALLAGERVARFPEVRGWSALDTARRAVTEHRARLDAEPGPPGLELGLLLSAARAALFHESVREGAPELCTTVADAARRIDAGHELVLYRAFRLHNEEPPAAVAAALRDRVRGLRAYQPSDPLD